MRTRSIKVSTTAVGNVGTGEDNLITFAIPADILYTNNDGFRFIMWGTYAANANNKTVKIKYGGTTIIDTTALATNGGTWRCEGEVLKTGATAQEMSALFTQTDGAGTTTVKVGWATPAETVANAITIKATGEATSNNDITQEALIILPIAYSSY